MSCARCDGRSSFSVVRFVGRRLVPQVIPCPSCQGSEADKLLIAVLRKRVEDLERRVVAATLELEATDMRSGFGHEEERPQRRYAGVDRVVEILRRPLDASDTSEQKSGDARPDAVSVVPTQSTPGPR